MFPRSQRNKYLMGNFNCGKKERSTNLLKEINPYPNIFDAHALSK